MQVPFGEWLPDLPDHLNPGATQAKNVYPAVNSVIGSNNCIIGIDYDEILGSIKLIATSDNLVKGAAGSAIQNMNIMFKFKEDEALSKYGIF